jgi:hypothetical protein
MAISNRVTRLLWSRSAGYCQNPECGKDLFHFFETGELISIEELAHIIPQSPDGPRGDEDEDRSNIDEYENIILLCPNCHVLVDKNPSHYSGNLLKTWKAEHSNKIKMLFVAPIINTREELRREVDRLRRRNHQIFLSYGPYSDYNQNPLSEAVEIWRRYIRTEIIPNNRRLAELLLVNERLLKNDELIVLEKFLIHKDAFEYNHLSGDKNPAAPRFPQEMDTILSD